MSCKDVKELRVSKNSLGYYIYVKELAKYLHKDGKVKAFEYKTGYFSNEENAEKALKEFKKKLCKSANVVSNQPIYLQLENETSPTIQPIKARLVTDHSGGRIVLQVQTPESPEFIPVARLAVKDGKVVMFREQGVESEFINTDSQGRIQN